MIAAANPTVVSTPERRMGLVVVRRVSYLGGMQFFSRLSPIRAYKDLRAFLSQRQPYELGFLALAIASTGFFVYAFMRDDYVRPPYTPNIIYVEQWPADRTDAQIRAQQKIDAPKKAKLIADQKAREAKLRAQFKTVDDAMTQWGL